MKCKGKRFTPPLTTAARLYSALRIKVQVYRGRRGPAHLPPTLPWVLLFSYSLLPRSSPLYLGACDSWSLCPGCVLPWLFCLKTTQPLTPSSHSFHDVSLSPCRAENFHSLCPPVLWTFLQGHRQWPVLHLPPEPEEEALPCSPGQSLAFPTTRPSKHQAPRLPRTVCCIHLRDQLLLTCPVVEG